MPETFVPLVAAAAKAPETGFASLNLKAPPAPASAPAACSKPTITLQKNGDIVSAIRVQCGCGQVVELTCVY